MGQTDLRHDGQFDWIGKHLADWKADFWDQLWGCFQAAFLKEGRRALSGHITPLPTAWDAKSLCAGALALCASQMAILPHIPWCSASQCRNSQAWKLQVIINVLVLIFFCQVFSTSNRKVWLIQSLDLNSPFFFSYSFLSKWEWPKYIILGRVQASWRREMKMERAHHMFWSSSFRLSHCLLPGWYFQVLGMCWTKVHQSYFSLSLALLSLRYMVQNRTQRETPWSYVSWGYPNFVLLAP